MDSNDSIPNSDTVTEEDNINAEDVTDYLNEVPAQIEKHLEFVASNRGGHILLGSSNLTGRYWCGSVWYYLDPFLAPDIEGSKAALEFPNGVTDCAFIDDVRAIVAQDGGSIDYVTIKDWEGHLLLERAGQIEDHGFSVVSVKLCCNGTVAITASMDMGDSRSVVEALRALESPHPVVCSIQPRQGVEVVFCWVLAHVSVCGNERADEAAKTASRPALPDPTPALPHTDYAAVIRGAILAAWWRQWRDAGDGNKMCRIASCVPLVSLDASIRLWDCHTTACTHNFTPAHTQEVTSVAPHPTRPEIFLSSSLDGNVLLWDLRSPKPASCVFRDVDNCPSAVSWVPSAASDSLNYLVGTLSGELHLRNPKVISHSLHTAQPFRRPIFRLTPNKYRFDEIAACANETKVKVFTIEDLTVKTSYCDDRHGDFVRGLEWLNEYCLVSCGWDKAVYHHSPTHQNHVPETFVH